MRSNSIDIAIIKNTIHSYYSCLTMFDLPQEDIPLYHLDIDAARLLVVDKDIKSGIFYESAAISGNGGAQCA